MIGKLLALLYEHEMITHLEFIKVRLSEVGIQDKMV